MTEASASWNNARQPSNVFAMAIPRSRAVVSQPSYDWLPAVIARLNELTSLQVGWDGYDAPPVAFENANFALQMLQSLCFDMDLEPSIVPGSAGDLQIEWHEVSSSVELHVRAPYDVHAWRKVNNTGVEEHLELAADFTDVLPWMTGLSGEPGAAVAAAN